jgi:hypothetical protein
MGHVLVAALDRRFVRRWPAHGAAELVGHEHRRDAAEGREHAHVAGDEVLDLLRPGRLDVREARRAEHAHKQLHGDDPAGERVDDLGPHAGVVDEDPLARAVVLSHRG